MLFQTLSQPFAFLSLSVVGFLSGFLIDLKNICRKILKNNKIITIFLDFFVFFLIFLIYFIFNLKINFGEFRIFSILSFFLSFFIQRSLVINFVAKPVVKCYNKMKEKCNAKRKKKV